MNRTIDENLTATFYCFFMTIFWEKYHGQIQMHKLCLKTYILHEYMEGNNKLLAEVTVKITFSTKMLYCSSLLTIRDYFKKPGNQSPTNECLQKVSTSILPAKENCYADNPKFIKPKSFLLSAKFCSTDHIRTLQ